MHWIAQHEAALADFKSMEETMRLRGLVAEREGLSAELE
jgi:hypothetical protein